MIDFLRNWTTDLVIFIIVISFLEMILPRGNMRKFVKMTIGLIVIIVIINPFIKLVQGEIDIEAEVFKNIERQKSYKDEGNTEFKVNQDKQIKDIYTDQIKKDIKANIIDETKYELRKCIIKIEENTDEDTYGRIKRIELRLTDKEDKNSSNIKNMNNIEVIKIDINIKNDIKDKENIGEKQIAEISNKEIVNIKEVISQRFKLAKEDIFIDLLTEE